MNLVTNIYSAWAHGKQDWIYSWQKCISQGCFQKWPVAIFNLKFYQYIFGGGILGGAEAMNCLQSWPGSRLDCRPVSHYKEREKDTDKR